MPPRREHPAKGWAAALDRTSLVRTDIQQDSSENQQRLNRQTARAFGLKLKPGYDFSEPGKSASKPITRRELERGINAIVKEKAVEALLVARRLRNPSQMGYALELWATVELRDGRVERAGQLYALAERGTRLVSDRVWPTDAKEHRQLDGELRAALGDRYEQALAKARTIDLDRAVAELVESDPVAQRLSDSRDGPTGAT